MKTSKISTKNIESNMTLRAVQPSDFGFLLEMDKKVYPTNFPVTREIMQSWYIKNPEFGMIYEKAGKVVGVMLVIPLNNESWQKLIKGNLKESEMTEKTIFDNSKDKKIGLHIYHLEKIDKNIKEFYKICLEDLNKIINKLKTKNPTLKIAGISALSVTSDGLGLFENKLNCKERDLVVDEHILEKNGKKFVASSKEEADKKIKEGYHYLNRCKMLIITPEEKSTIWDYLTESENKTKIAEKALLVDSQEPEGVSIKGYDFNKKFDFNELIKSFASTGAQASNLARAIEIVKKMRKEKAFIYLGYTSNMVTTGNREIIKYLT